MEAKGNSSPMGKRNQRSPEALAYRKLYDSPQWRGPHGARQAQLKRQPLCENCLKYGRITAADTVDHIVAHKGNRHLFLDPRNHQSLCMTCHSSDKQAVEKGGTPRQRIGLDGWPVV